MVYLLKLKLNKKYNKTGEWLGFALKPKPFHYML